MRIPEDLEPVGFEERAVCDDNVDAGVEPRPDESGRGDCRAPPELVQIVSAALHEGDVVHVDVSRDHAVPPHELRKPVGHRALAGPDRPDEYDEIGHERMVPDTEPP